MDEREASADELSNEGGGASDQASRPSWPLSLHELIAAGAQFTELSLDRARTLVDGLVQEGRVRSDTASDVIDELVEASRERARSFRTAVRAEIDDAVSTLRVPSRDEFDELERRLTQLVRDAEAAFTTRWKRDRSAAPEDEDAARAQQAAEETKKQKKSKKKKKKKKKSKKSKHAAAASDPTTRNE